MYNNQIIKMYDLKNRIKKHPYDTILNLDEFIKISKEHFLTSAICSVAPNENNFLNAKQIEMEPQQNIESIENEINKCRANTNIDFKFYYCYFWHDPFESKEQKEQIINHLEQNQLPQIYIYDWESKTGNTMPMNELHKIINYVLELTPQQWFDKFKNDYFKQIFNDEAIEEMQQMFLHMPFDVLEIKQPTLFDDVESYQPQINIIESKEHQFFEILLLNIDLFIDDEQGIKSYYDYLLQIQMEQCDNKITMLDCNLNNVNDKIKYYEQQPGIQDLASYQHQINEIVALIDDVSFYSDYSEIMPNNDNIINIAQSKTKQLNDIQNTTPYLYYLALKQYINNRIDLLKDKQIEVQQQMENCKKIGTTEYFINANIKKYLSMINKNDIVNIDIENVTNNRVPYDIMLLSKFARGYKEAYDNGAIATNNSIILTNQMQMGIVGNIRFGIETFDNEKQFNFDYMALYSALVGYWMINGTKPFTTKQLYENYMNKDNEKHPSEKIMQWINNAILDMAKSWLSLNGTIENNNDYIKEGYFLPIEPINITPNKNIVINGFLFNDEYIKQNPYNRIWRLLKAPLLYDISQDNKQLTVKINKEYLQPQPNSNLPTPNIHSQTTITIRQQLAFLIYGIQNGSIKNREFVLREFLTNNCHIGERSKKQIDVIKHIIKQYLDIATENGHIKGYEFRKSTKNKNYISFYIK